MYYELTYNGDKHEWYLDVYKKFQDAVVKDDGGSKGDKIMEWIPCTERLPEKNGRYLVTRGSNVCGSLWDKVDILNYSDLMGLKKEKNMVEWRCWKNRFRKM